MPAMSSSHQLSALSQQRKRPAQLDATPYFVDVDEASFNIDPASLEEGIADAMRQGSRPRAIIAVDLFGSQRIMPRCAPSPTSTICC